MANINPTRMELLNLKKKVKLAKKGHKLLKQKRDVLVMEFFSLLKEIKSLRESIKDKIIKAQNSLYNAHAIEGELNIDRISAGLAEGISITFGTKSIMGVKVPSIEDVKIKPQWHGFYGQSLELDNAIMNYRDVFPDFLKLSEKQLILKRLSEEIKKTKRRVNSLEYLTIPRLVKTQKFIAFKLEEMERENFSRLKKIKEQTAK